MSPLPAIAVQFYDVSEGNVDSWFWEFGDGETSQEQNPMHVFYTDSVGPDGSFNPFTVVKLTIFTLDSCISLYSDTIQVYSPPVDPGQNCRAYFKYYQTVFDTINGTATVQFKAMTENDSLIFNWDFGNGETSAAQNPEIIFDASTDTYMACLKVTGSEDCTSSYCEPVIIKNPYQTGIDSTECFAGFYYKINHEVETFAPALVLDFYSQNENAVEWRWDFGDGTLSDEPNPIHIFNYPLDKDSAGNMPDPYRNVCLTVRTATGCEATSCQTINIYMNDSIYPKPEPDCHARFKYYKPNDVFSIPEMVLYRFIDVSEGDVISRLWEFEDGTVSTDEVVDKGFDFMTSSQKVCLTVETADSCTSTWCETIFVSSIPPDTNYIPAPLSEYSIRYEAYFPVWMSSCAGTVKATVYQNDSVINATNFVWSNGAEGQKAEGFCPTQTYSVKAITPDGYVVSGTFVFNADGTVTEVPVNWWISDSGDVIHTATDKRDPHYQIHWTLCDGTVVVQDSIPLNMINCDGTETNMFLTDSMGNVIYSESISLKAIATMVNTPTQEENIQLFPNPFNDVLNIQYNGKSLQEMQIELSDITGKRILLKSFYDVRSGDNISLNLSSLKKGIYVSRISTGNRIIAQQKLVK